MATTTRLLVPARGNEKSTIRPSVDICLKRTSGPPETLAADFKVVAGTQVWVGRKEWKGTDGFEKDVEDLKEHKVCTHQSHAGETSHERIV